MCVCVGVCVCVSVPSVSNYSNYSVLILHGGGGIPLHVRVVWSLCDVIDYELGSVSLSSVPFVV